MLLYITYMAEPQEVNRKLLDLYKKIKKEVDNEILPKTEKFVEEANDYQVLILTLAYRFVLSVSKNIQKDKKFFEQRELIRGVRIGLDLDEFDKLRVVDVTLYEVKGEDCKNKKTRPLKWKSERKVMSSLYCAFIPSTINPSEYIVYDIDNYDFALALFNSKSQEGKNIRAMYTYGTTKEYNPRQEYPFASVYIDVATGLDMNLPVSYMTLLDQWIMLHDSCYLERVYGLERRPRQYSTPRLIHNVEEYFKYVYLAQITNHQYLTGSQDTLDFNVVISGNAPFEVSIYKEGNVDMKNLDLDVEEGIEFFYSVDYGESIVDIHTEKEEETEDEDEKIVKQWQSLNLDRVLIVLDRRYRTKREASEARFRFLKQCKGLKGITRNYQPGAVGCVLADTIRPDTFERTEYNYMYIERNQDEEIWREICNREMSTPTDIDELIKIAINLDMSIPRNATRNKLCSMISEQYAREFDERARIRYLSVKEWKEKEIIQKSA